MEEQKKSLAECEFKFEEHEHNGKTMTDVVCYLCGKRFVLAPIYTSKKAKAFFYALLTNTERV